MRRTAHRAASACPGGETIDSLVVWLPDDGVALVGNMFSALFGHFPNLVTVRGDRLRSTLAFVDSVQRVIDLEPELLLLGHHGPVRGAAPSAASASGSATPCSTSTRPTVAAMNNGLDVWTAMRTIRLPEALELGEAYGRVDWSVRAIWETYGRLDPPALDARALRRVARAGSERDRRAGRRDRRGRAPGVAI